jgi:curved DNA-binding protein CbpA
LRGSLTPVKAAYRKAALAHHPDRGGSTEAIQRINEANDVLSDPDRRARYDESLCPWRATPLGTYGGAYPGASFQTWDRPSAYTPYSSYGYTGAHVYPYPHGSNANVSPYPPDSHPSFSHPFFERTDEHSWSRPDEVHDTTPPARPVMVTTSTLKVFGITVRKTVRTNTDRTWQEEVPPTKRTGTPRKNTKAYFFTRRPRSSSIHSTF